MIIPGKNRGDGRQLADYLLNDPKNDSAVLLESRGFEPGSLEDQLVGSEEAALANTRARSPFYFAAFRPDADETLTREQAMWGIERLEQKLGLEGQPRVIVAHVFHGQEHLHVVWDRYDRETGKMRETKFDARARLEVAAEMEERFGLRTLNRGGHEDRGHARQWEDGQDERSAKKKAERSDEITQLWNTTDSGKAFRAGLEAAAYTLAFGKARAYCVVDGEGEVHSLARHIKGAKTADVKARLSDLDPASIPEAEAVKSAIKQARADRAETDAPKKTTRPTKAARAADREADAAEIRAAETDYTDEGLPHVTTPRERTEAERQASAGIASTILNNLTWGRSTFTRADLEREAAKMTGHHGRESWMAQEGGLDALDKPHRASAERSYDKWAEENPIPAEKYGLADYVGYTQRMEAARRAEADPEVLKDRAAKAEAFKFVMEALDQSGEIVTARIDPENERRTRYTSRAMLDTGLRMEAAAASLGERNGHAIREKVRDTALKQTETQQGFELSPEQRAAFRHVTGDSDISLVVGYAGAGKSTMLNAARGAFEAEGFRVRGTALSGIAAQGLENSAGIKSETLHSLLHKLDSQAEREATGAARIARISEKMGRIKGRSDKAQNYRNDLAQQITETRADMEKGRLSGRDVIFVDEAATIGARQLERLLAHAFDAGAKVILVGDHEQTQAIEAGAAFRALADRHPPAIMKDIRRQAEDWQREATRGFPEGRAREALNAYHDHGMTHETASRDDAKAQLIDAWATMQREQPERSSAIFTHLNADVHDLNKMGRQTFRDAGRLGEDQEVTLKEGSITLAEGDRFLFRKNDRRLDVKNGSLGTVREIDGDTITVALDTASGRAGQGREVKFKVAEYQEFSHGYAATVHKTQGATVDRAFVLATPGMDRHIAYVAMSRHRERVDLFHAREDFKDHDAMTRRLSRDGAKDDVLDYLKRVENGEKFGSTFRAAVAGLWDRIASVFRRGEHHPAETAERGREQAVRDNRRPGQSFMDAVRALAEKDRKDAEATRAAEPTPPPKVDPAHAKERVRPATEATPRTAPPRPAAQKPDTEEARQAARTAEIDRLRAAEAKKRRDDPQGPGGRGE